MVKYLASSFVLLLLISYSSFSQDSLKRHHHSAYVELGGAAYIGYSGNYEFLFTDFHKREYALRFGCGINPYKHELSGFYNGPNHNSHYYYYTVNTTLYIFPIELLVMTGHINHGSVEIGAGLIPAIEAPKKDTRDLKSAGFFQLGYRYQGIRRVIFRADLTYLLLANYYYYNNSNYFTDFDRGGQFWGGVSLGYCFK